MLKLANLVPEIIGLPADNKLDVEQCVSESGSTELQRVTAGDGSTCESITSNWSNGVVEGHVKYLKMLKRQMYVRARLKLLRRRLMSPLA